MFSLIERPMTEAEYAQLLEGFAQHDQESQNPVEKAERMGFVALKGNLFIGSSSGLSYHSERGYNPYFYLTDLYVEKAFRRQGLGKQLLTALELKIEGLGIDHIWTWTAGYEGKDFYLGQGYSIFAELEGFYASGHSRFGLRKKLKKRLEVKG
jgi:ribosomal protein S18 acetylase RimI-like enzyme